MYLTVPEVAELLKMSESEVNDWVSSRDLPAEQVNGQYRFNKTELLEWATVRKLAVPPAIFPDPLAGGVVRLEDALREGGVLHGIRGADKEAVLQAVLRAMPLPADLDRDFLLQVFLSREALGSTGIGDGVAIPHPRYPVVLPGQRALVTVAFLEQPIGYSSLDSQPVHTLFVLVSPTAREHLRLLARLSFALRDPGFREVIQRKGTAAEVLQQAQRLEESLHVSERESGR